MSHAKTYRKLPADSLPSKRKQRGRGRKVKGAGKSETSATESPAKKVCIVTETFTDDDEELLELKFSEESETEDGSKEEGGDAGSVTSGEEGEFDGSSSSES